MGQKSVHLRADSCQGKACAARLAFNQSWISLCVAERHRALDGETSRMHGQAQAHGRVVAMLHTEIKFTSTTFRIRIMLGLVPASFASLLDETIGCGQCDVR